MTHKWFKTDELLELTLSSNDIDELSELILLEGLTLEQAKKHILKRMEKERLEHLNNLILTKLGV